MTRTGSTSTVSSPSSDTISVDTWCKMPWPSGARSHRWLHAGTSRLPTFIGLQESGLVQWQHGNRDLVGSLERLLHLHAFFGGELRRPVRQAADVSA
jgi:hypothetical protein